MKRSQVRPPAWSTFKKRSLVCCRLTSEVRIPSRSPREQVVFGHGSVWLVAEVRQRFLDHVGALRAMLRRWRRRRLVARNVILVDDVERSRWRRFRRIFRNFWNFAQADLGDTGRHFVRRCRHRFCRFEIWKSKYFMFPWPLIVIMRCWVWISLGADFFLFYLRRSTLLRKSFLEVQQYIFSEVSSLKKNLKRSFSTL